MRAVLINHGLKGEYHESQVCHLVLAVSLVLVFGARMAMAQDLAKVSPDAKVLFENDRVRVLDIQHQPGGKEPMHTHPRIHHIPGRHEGSGTTPDGKTVVRDRKAGTFNLVNRLRTLWRTRNH
jgi:hypothetical protein